MLKVVDIAPVSDIFNSIYFIQAIPGTSCIFGYWMLLVCLEIVDINTAILDILLHISDISDISDFLDILCQLVINVETSRYIPYVRYF